MENFTIINESLLENYNWYDFVKNIILSNCKYIKNEAKNEQN